MLLTPWGRVSCTCTAASVAMVIYAHSPHLNEPPNRGSHKKLLETKNSALELQLTAAPKTSIITSAPCYKCLEAGAAPLEYSSGRA